MKPEWPALLAPGFHTMSLDELQRVAVDAFPASQRRPLLFSGLKRFVAEVKTLGLTGEWWVDGSFLSLKPEPDDIDMVLFWDPACVTTVTAASQDRLHALFHGRDAVTLYNCQAFPEKRGDQNRQVYWRGVFGFSWRNIPKGVVVLAL